MSSKSSHKSGRSRRNVKSLVAEKAGALNPRDSVETAAQRMREMGTKSWPVAEERTLVGMVEDRHADVTIGSHGHDPKAWRVSEIMNSHAVFCYEDEDCVNAWQLMEKHDLNYIPVVDRGMQLVGIFDRKEIAKKVSTLKAAGQ